MHGPYLHAQPVNANCRNTALIDEASQCLAAYSCHLTRLPLFVAGVACTTLLVLQTEKY